MDDNNSKQNNDIFVENCCIKCHDPKSGQEELSVTRELDKLIQYDDFIGDERLQQYLLDSEKNGISVKIHCGC